MSVYVDDLRDTSMAFIRNWPYAEACHLMADSDAELEAFARSIGLRRGWRHGDHYDLTRARRAVAVRAGAIEVTARRLVEIRKQHEHGRSNRRR